MNIALVNQNLQGGKIYRRSGICALTMFVHTY